jgi:hypothetical protein
MLRLSKEAGGIMLNLINLIRLPRALGVLALIICMLGNSPAFAQNTNTTAANDKKAIAGPRKQLATIVFAGLGGAILGLSTLSFYGRPQDKLSNIAIGFAFGVIGGTAFVTFKAATNPSELYGEQRWLEREHELTSIAHSPYSANASPLQMKFDFEF